MKSIMIEMEKSTLTSLWDFYAKEQCQCLDLSSLNDYL